MRSYLIVLFVQATLFAPAYAEQDNESVGQLVDKLLVFTDKQQFAEDLATYHRKLIVPAVERYYSSTPLRDDPQVTAIASEVIDSAVARAVAEENIIEAANREYFLNNLSAEELRAIVAILKLPNGKKILLNFSAYLGEAKVIRVTKGRAMRNSIEQEIFDRLVEYRQNLSPTETTP